MNDHKSVRKETIIGVVAGVLILVAFNLIVANALTVKPLPAQPALKVEQGQSVFYEDGSVDLQPATPSAGRTLQTTVEHNILQGN